MILLLKVKHTARKMKFSINDFFGKCDQIRSFLRIWSHLLMGNFIFSAVTDVFKIFAHVPFDLISFCLFVLTFIMKMKDANYKNH